MKFEGKKEDKFSEWFLKIFEDLYYEWFEYNIFW